MTEIEFKYQLTAKDFALLSKRLISIAAGDISSYGQENFFFDTPKLELKSNGAILRLRKERGIFILCAKRSVPAKADHDPYVFSRFECEQAIDEDVAHMLLDGEIGDLSLIGSFSNLRTAIPIKLGDRLLVFELDRSTYAGGQVIYEVEIEVDSEGDARIVQPAIEQLFSDLKLAIKPSMAKSARFFLAIDQR